MIISIIVPIYNVAEYLPRCIQSIVSQSYKQLEILLVDDGSTDESGEIAEQYAKQDARIQVIHKKNRGLSDARNVGMTKATGEYLFFLDSDDWLALNALENLVEVMARENADIVVGDFYYAYDHSIWRDERYWGGEIANKVLNNKEAMRALVDNTIIKNFAWGKLYKTEMIKDILFEKGKLFEDVYWQHQVFERSKKCVVINQPIVNYYQRENSIVSKFQLKKLDMLEGMHSRYQFIKRKYPELEEAARYALLKVCMEYLSILYLHRKEIKNVQYVYKIRQYICEEYTEFDKCSKKDQTLNKQLKLLSVHFYLFIGYKGYHRVMRQIGLYKIPKGLTKIEGMGE